MSHMSNLDIEMKNKEIQIPLNTKRKYIPYTVITVNGKKMEIISYPFYADYANPSSDIRIKVREPNDPTTMIEVPLTEVHFE